ncbi:hypothetical protein SAMN06265795_105199 [Noviherbaspirillum humi]|uniref:Uncharacterized protein n=1 Tax=Noviherbaspirillum humi TaxID=1688639 RepID=A0A239GXI8_9BURK|nr:hypothetical protein [Noviherbaspirillum humi]SNS72764.1 hypothetical protein SAMN06265795_105199 [Noviherbaspirillum humi]
MQKSRVVVIIENHSVSEVIKNDPDVDVLVIDRDTYACDRHTRLRGVCGDDAALDAMAHGLAIHNPEKVDKAFVQVYEALKKKGENSLAECVAEALFGKTPAKSNTVKPGAHAGTHAVLN